MNPTIQQIILQKCSKKVRRLTSYDEEEVETLDVEEEEEEEEEEDESEIVEELPFEDILAEKRRKYSAKEEFIFLLYTDILNYFVAEWDGKYLRKKPKTKIVNDSGDTSDEGEHYYEESCNDNADEFIEFHNGSEEFGDNISTPPSNLPWKITLPDEFANITFINNNTYSGHISRKMMEGEGVYRWTNGAQYKGHFEQNRMHGRGLLEWNSTCWYEGDFINGYRQGRGIMVDGDNRYMYTGQWFKSQRHGKGYCRHVDNGSYDGDWIIDKMNGVGLRIYASGARYVGHWKNGVRHGTGTMVWTNGNVYHGEWNCGAMNGYGEYIWNGFFNKTFTWPQKASYVGSWRNGMRHGEGEIKLNSVGGARYSGYWKDNKKHGYGIIIGNNGEKFEANPLFLNDTLCTIDDANDFSENETEVKDEQKCVRTAVQTEPLFIEKSDKLAEASITPISRPEQFPCLSYYITRLLGSKNMKPSFVPIISSGKCYKCENESCSCLTRPLSIDTLTSERKDFTGIISSKMSTEGTLENNWQYEERWMYNCLTLHMFRLRKIYNDYATLFAKPTPNFNVSMSRLCLWQLWRDCGIHTKGISLNDIDIYIKKNEAALVNDPHYPFEKIEIWQYLHALIEVSFHLYSKESNVDDENVNGKLAAGFHKFLKCDIYPHAGNHVGNLCQDNCDLLPMYCVFELYQQTGYPPSAKDFLRVTCVLKGTIDSQPSSTTVETVRNFPSGINTMTMGERVSYLFKSDGILQPPYCTIDLPKRCENDFSMGLLVFKQMGASKLIQIMASICPGIKDTNSDVIINMDYKLTFLEFYEIILEATKQLLSSKKEAEKELQKKKMEEETASMKTTTSLSRKDIKQKYRPLT